MRKILTATVGAAALLAALAAVPVASAATTELGDQCVAGKAFDAPESTIPVTIFETAAPANPLPNAAPVSGTITSWRINIDPLLGTPPSLLQLRVLRLDRAAKTATVVGVANGIVQPGPNVLPTQIPVQAGDYLAIYVPPNSRFYLCPTAGKQTTIGGALGTPELGATLPFEEHNEEEGRLALSATIETGEGGQISPPPPAPKPVNISTRALTARNRVTVLVATDAAAPVTVTGTVKLGRGKPRTLKAAPQTVAPGTIAPFVLKLSKPVLKRLRSMKPSQKLGLSITATATNAAGQPSAAKLTARLKGLAPRG